MSGANYPQGKISFTGISNSVGGSMTFSRGITPGVCILRTIPEPLLISTVGDLVIEYGGNTMIFRNCAVNTHTLTREQRNDQAEMKIPPGRYWNIQILDRRWAWSYKKISGEYNVRLPDDSVRYSGNHDELRKSLRELAELCLVAMGERQYDISELPDNVYPYVNWTNVNPAMELQALCDMVSCVIVYNWYEDRVKVWRNGIGAALPADPTQIHPTLPVSVSRRPDKVAVECWPTKYQLQFELEAVGMDVDGQIKKLDDLSYKPTSDKWQYDWWCAFPGVAVANRHLAYKTVFRWYRIKGMVGGGLSVPGVSETIKTIDQFELEDGVVEVAEDFDGMPQTLPMLMKGEFWPQCPWQAMTPDTTVYSPNGFHILPEHKNIIEFDYPVLKINTGGTYEQAKMLLTARCRIRREDGDWYISQTFERHLPWLSGAGSRILKHPELWEASVLSSVTGGGESSNLDTVEAEADVYLQYVTDGYQIDPAEDLGYGRILPILLDGAIAQVHWTCGKGMTAHTRISRNHEFDMYTPSYEWRRRYEKVDSLADRELL